MKKLLLFLLLTNGFLGICQNNKIKAAKTETSSVNADVFYGFDALGSYYYSKDNVFFKQKNDVKFEYKNPSLGKITKIDIQNPLKLVLFYEDFNTIVTLDNQLNETQKINFSEIEIPINVHAMGIASQNRFWIFDSLNLKIGLFDYLKNDYKTISQPISGNIKFYESDFNTFYWIDEKNNFYAIDNYGKTTQLGIIPDFDLLEIINSNQIIYKKDQHLFFVDLNKNLKTEIENLEKTFENLSYKNQILTIFTDQQFTNYKIKIP